MSIIEHFDTSDQAKARAGDLIGFEALNRVYGLMVTSARFSPVVGGCGWNVEIQTKLVELPPTYKGVVLPWIENLDRPAGNLDDAYQKVLEENGVLREQNTTLRKNAVLPNPDAINSALLLVARHAIKAAETLAREARVAIAHTEAGR